MSTQVSDLALGKFLQIAFSDGIRSQISEDFRDWEHIKSVREGDPNGRQLNFFVQTAFGPAAVQSRNAGSAGKFPTAQKSRSSEHTAIYKEIDTTVEIEYALWNRARKSIDKYAEPLLNEMETKMIASKRYIASKLYQDGSGILGVVASAADNTTTDQVVVTLNVSDAVAGYSHVGYFEYDELLAPKQDTGTPATARAASVTGTFYAWRVVDKDRDNNTVTIEAVDADGAQLQLTASNLVAGDFFVKVGQETVVAPSTITGSTDYGSFTDVIVGLESLAAKDGRLCHGMTLSGALGGTEVNANGDPLDASQIRKVLDNAKIRVGESKYSYKKICLAPEAEAAFIESRETDRRFNSVEDTTRGARLFTYQHRQDTLETYTSEFCPLKRIYMLPEQKNGNKVLEYHGSDFEAVEMAGMGKFHLKPHADGGHARVVSSYMEAIGQLICKHPAAIGRLRNFTI
jgi:hypothetical protein